MFDNRKQAGVLLADRVASTIKIDNCVVLGITRGGVVVAFEVAKKLSAPLDIIVIKKIGAPGNPELAIGAVGPNKTVIWDLPARHQLSLQATAGGRYVNGETVDPYYKEQAVLAKEKERSEQEERLRWGKKPLSLSGKDVILVDDGVATGMTVLCAAKFIKLQKAGKITLAVPVIAKETMTEFANEFDIIVAFKVEDEFGSVGQFYKEFPQVTDQEVIRILNSKF